MYWVDPNAGCEADAIEVKCDFHSYENIETCVYPTQGYINVDTHVRSYTGAHQWWSEMDSGMPISYDPAYEQRVPRADYASQITFLRLLASQVRQKVEYTCEGGEADLILRGTGAAEFDMDHTDVEVVGNSCDGASGKATLEVLTSATAAMPIRDIATKHVGDGNKFGFAVGAVCFS